QVRPPSRVIASACAAVVGVLKSPPTATPSRPLRNAVANTPALGPLPIGVTLAVQVRPRSPECSTLACAPPPVATQASRAPGGETLRQLCPPSVVRSTVPRLPLTQATLRLTADRPRKRAAVVPVGCTCQTGPCTPGAESGAAAAVPVAGSRVMASGTRAAMST